MSVENLFVENIEDPGVSSEFTFPECRFLALMPPVEEKLDWKDIHLPKKNNLLGEVLYNIKNFINTDLRVIVDDEEFQCHLLVLQCYSEFFDELNSSVTEVELPSNECTPCAFNFIYEWAIADGQYEGFNRANILEVFVAARYLKVKELEEQCWTLIDNPDVFNEATAYQLYVDAKKRSLPEVCDIMLPRIKIFFLPLVSTKEWVELECEEVQAFLRSNLICVGTEIEAFMSAVRWLMHDWDNRKKHTNDILSCVRFGNMPGWQLIDIKRNKNNPEFNILAKEPCVQKLIETGLVNFILKLWNDGHNYEANATAFDLVPVAQRNYTGDTRIFFTYREFLVYLDQLFKHRDVYKEHLY